MTDQEDAAYQAEGEALTAEILALAAPLVDGKPAKLIVQVMAGVMLSTVMIAAHEGDARRKLLRMMAWTLTQIADGPAVDEE